MFLWTYDDWWKQKSLTQWHYSHILINERQWPKPFECTSPFWHYEVDVRDQNTSTTGQMWAHLGSSCRLKAGLQCRWPPIHRILTAPEQGLHSGLGQQYIFLRLNCFPSTYFPVSMPLFYSCLHCHRRIFKRKINEQANMYKTKWISKENIISLTQL